MCETMFSIWETLLIFESFRKNGPIIIICYSLLYFWEKICAILYHITMICYQHFNFYICWERIISECLNPFLYSWNFSCSVVFNYACCKATLFNISANVRLRFGFQPSFLLESIFTDASHLNGIVHTIFWNNIPLTLYFNLIYTICSICSLFKTASLT